MKTEGLKRLIEGTRIPLRGPGLSDFEEFSLKSQMSADFHRDLVFPPGDIDSFKEYVDKEDSKTDCCFVIIERESGEIAGAVNVSQIFMKGFCSAYLGYYLFAGFEGRGLMTEALTVVVAFCFSEIGLHRLEANIQPHNDSSRRLVEKCGFVKEGFSSKYLKIGDEWRDHERWAIIAEDWDTKDSR